MTKSRMCCLLSVGKLTLSKVEGREKREELRGEVLALHMRISTSLFPKKPCYYILNQLVDNWFSTQTKCNSTYIKFTVVVKGTCILL